jgi:tetratricopeptide (TPR) repeat protein
MNGKSNQHCTRIVIAICCAAFCTTALAASEDELGDLAARLQYGYYSADARALQRAIQEIEKIEVDPKLNRARDYQLGYGQWKLAETLLKQDGSAARRAAAACIDVTDRALEAVPKRLNIPKPDVLHAELHAIQAGCYIARRDSSRAGKALEEGLALQPSNPRILLVAGAFAIGHAKSSADRAAAERSIASAVTAFDLQPPQAPGAADWGHAEALALLGEIQLAQGNGIGARNSLERALVIAPDYTHARTLLARATGGR